MILPSGTSNLQKFYDLIVLLYVTFVLIWLISLKVFRALTKVEPFFYHVPPQNENWVRKIIRSMFLL